MPPSVHPQLIARLAGMLAIGMSLPPVVNSAVLSFRGISVAAPTNSSVGMILGSILYVSDQLSWSMLWWFMRTCWPAVLGLASGLYWVFGGTWPIPWLIKWERTRG